MKKPSSAPDTKNMERFSRALAVSVAAGVTVTFLILSAFAALMTVRDLPHSAVVPMSILGVAAGTILAGYCCARILRERGLLWGLGCGAVIFLLALFCELMLLGQPIGVLALYKFIIYAASGMIGGVLGVNKKRKVR
ncbi:MAG: TIGR04086 family membrane protein [Angelakisella sp.]|jgi:putative membrane protein (TIGR04086 family)|nr:TIGR04086 family membrane protein [Angelakisella sp.]